MEFPMELMRENPESVGDAGFPNVNPLPEFLARQVQASLSPNSAITRA